MQSLSWQLLLNVMNKIIVVIFLLVLSACGLDVKGKSGMYKSTEALQQYCVGRHIISIPASFPASAVTTGIFRLKNKSAQDPAFDVVIQSDVATKSKFSSAVQQRREELSRSESKTMNVLKLDKVLPDGMVIFRVQEIDDAYFSEIYFTRGAAMVKVRLESYRNSYLEAEEELFKIASTIRERKLDNVQNGGGFCLGPLIFYADLSHESADFVFRNNSGLKISIDIDTYARDDSVTLHSRMSGDNSLLNAFKVRHDVLRASERTVAGMHADEWLGVAHLGDQGDQRVLKFALETRRKNPGKSHPSIMLTFDSAQPLKDGAPTVTTIRDEEALGLWDAVVESIALTNETDSKSPKLSDK
jgi:hypothetical protein